MNQKFRCTILLLAGLFINFAQAQQPTDCVDAVIVCGNSEINLNPTGIGTQELSGTNNCGSFEHASLWLSVTTVTNGTLGFILRPGGSELSIDYDFFVYGPDVPCNNIGQAIRCSTTNPIASGQSNNLTGMNGGETDTSEGPGPDGNSFVRWLDVNAGETYYIVIDRAVDDGGFTLEWLGSAEFASPPSNEAGNNSGALNMESCDIIAPFDDGSTEFNLEDNTSLILGTQNNVSVTYHISENDANIGINSLFSPYPNVGSPQTIYARITNNNTGCFDLTEFELNVSSGPDFMQPSTFNTCDSDDDGDATNGFTLFDLDSKNDEILDGQSDTVLNVSYHETQFNAENDLGHLPSPYYSDNQQIFVRIEDIANPDCNSVTTMNLNVVPLPTFNNTTLIQCDEDGIPDGITRFNLYEAENDITANASGITLKFHENILDAESDTNEVDGTNYMNLSTPQTIHVQVIDDTSGCISIAELVLNVSTTQISDYQAPAQCDELDSEDGVNIFDLNAFTTDIQTINSITLPITYYETYQDALLEQNALATPYTNTNNPYTHTIYARAENANACYGISEVSLTVNPLPELLGDETTFYCLNTYPDTITLEAGVLNDNPNNYTYIWSSGQMTNQIQINETGTYTVTVTNQFNCSKERTITVEPSNIATIDSVDIIDGNTSNTVIVNASGEGTYEYALNTIEGILYLPYQSDTTFNDVLPGIYTVLIRDIKNGCGVVEQVISVLGFPQFFTPNNDGYHDTWQVIGASQQINGKVKIFNRHGKLLKELNSINEEWDGTFNGELLPVDDYWFAVELLDGRSFVNHFSLKR